jgi:hypothetical protein
MDVLYSIFSTNKWLLQKKKKKRKKERKKEHIGHRKFSSAAQISIFPYVLQSYPFQPS